MKQIKVPLTPREWAEKRLQLLLKEFPNHGSLLVIDELIVKCGFYLVEETQIEPASNGQNTDVNMAGDIYQPLFDYLQEWCDFIAIQDEMNTIVNLCRPIIEHLDKPDENQRKADEIPTDKVEAVKYFLNQLPDGYKQRALAQVDYERVNSHREATVLQHALAYFALWSKTKEGVAFWNDVDNHYRRPSQFPTLPPLPNDDNTTLKEWTGYFTDKGERVYLNGVYEHGAVKMKIQIKEGEYFCVREDGFSHPINHIFNYHKP